MGEQFFGVVDVVDLGWAGAVGPGQAILVGDDGAVVAAADPAVVGTTGEIQFVSVGLAAVHPVRRMVDFTVVAGC